MSSMKPCMLIGRAVGVVACFVLALPASCEPILSSGIIEIEDVGTLGEASEGPTRLTSFYAIVPRPHEPREPTIARDVNVNPPSPQQWQGAFIEAARGSWLRVRTGGLTGVDIPSHWAVLAVERDPEEVDSFVRGLEAQQTGSGVACACIGTLTFELFREDILLLSLSLHHGDRLRGGGVLADRDGESSWDAKLSAHGANFVADWLSRIPVGVEWAMVSLPQTSSEPCGGSDPVSSAAPSVMIDEERFWLVPQDAEAFGPCDMATLEERLDMFKLVSPNTCRVVVLAGRDTPYPVIVGALEAVVGGVQPQFPSVALALESPWSMK